MKNQDIDNKIKTNENNLSQIFLHYLEKLNTKYAKKFIIHSNLDGQYNGVLFEFKKEYNDKLKRDALIECIKNASKLRLLAKDVPAKFALTFLKDQKIYIYNSLDFYTEIHTIYQTSASKKEEIELGKRIKEVEMIDYSDGYENITTFLNKKENTAFLKIDIDKNNVVAMAERFYKESGTKKRDFYNELINPNILKYIKPFATNEQELNQKCLREFPDLIDKINDIELKKQTGAFYTPSAYCELSTQMVRKAIKNIKDANPENDYIILDRCAGTGSLEQFLTDDELSHTICSTFEMWEWKVLNERYKSDKPNKYGQYTKLRLIIPPEMFIETQRRSTIVQTIKAGDALSEHFITGKVSQNNLFDFIDESERLELNKEYEQSIQTLNGYIQNQNCNVIILENPPYSEIAGNNIKQEQKRDGKIDGFVTIAMKDDLPNFNNSNISTARDISNLFIWSAFKYYLLQPSDSYIVFSPVKYFKSIGLANKQFNEGYLLNRKHFHASPSAISLIWWQNIDEKKETFTLKAYDIELKKKDGLSPQERTNQGTLKYEKDVEVKRVYETFTKYFDKREFEKDIKNNIWCESSGVEVGGRKCDGTSLYNDNILGYIQAIGFAIDSKHYQLLRQIYFRSRGFYLRSDNFVEKLPLFCAKLYPQSNWYERDVYFTTADGGFEYVKDEEFLKSCLIFTCLSQKNHCRSFLGSDGKWYYNELCLGQNTLADEKLKTFTQNDDDEKIIAKWKLVLNEAKRIKTDIEKWGLYQIEQELIGKKKGSKKETKINVMEHDEDYYYAETEQEITQSQKTLKADCGNLVSYINELKTELKTYYAKHIQDKLFKYELLK